ncbi:MAG: response regulator transcription factor [Sphingobacteriales bacterium]|nr:MAG: response regulator transcription factor [Sphingobacteriales bacterium]
MNALKIGLVEDNLVIAEAISEMLAECGYTVTRPAKRYSEAIALIEQEAPDLLLLDIMLLGDRDGIEVAQEVQQRGNRTPCIFLTSNTDFETIRRARDVRPAAFLAKPATKAQLYAAIEIAIDQVSNRNATTEPLQQAPSETEGVFVKQGSAFRRILFTDVLLAESRDNYLRLITTTGEEVLLRSTLGDFLERVPGFLQTHRSFAIARKQITGLSIDEVYLGSRTVPLSKTYRLGVLETLGVR